MKKIQKILFVATMVAMTATNAFAGTLTGDDSNNANPIDITGSTAGTISLAGDATLSATGGNAVVTSTDAGVDIDGATTVDIDSGATVTIDSTTTTALTSGTGTSITATTGDVDITATAGDINLTGNNLTFNGAAIATATDIAGVRDEMRSEDARLKRGIAMVAAMVTPVIEEGDTQAVRATTSTFAGEYGMALGYARRLSDGVQVGVDAATTSDLDEMTARVSVNYSW